MRITRSLLTLLAVAALLMAGCVPIPPPPGEQVSAEATQAEPSRVTAVVATAPPAPESSSTPTPAPALIAAPTASPATVEAGCLADPGQAGMVRPDDGFCFSYPERFKVDQTGSGRVSLAGPPLDKNAEPVFATLEVTVADAPPAGLKAAVDKALAEYAPIKGLTINRMDVQLGGEPAVIAEPIPGRLSGRVLYAEHANKLYRLYFWPVDVDYAVPEVNELYNSVIGSWQFVPPGPAKSISGRVLWGEAPAPGAKVELRTTDWPENTNSLIAATVAGADGKYEFQSPESGRYELVPAWPAGEVGGAGAQGAIPVTVPPGGAITDADLYLSKPVKLLEPAGGAQVETAPSLRWEAVPGAVLYRVIVTDPATMKGGFAADTAETSVKIDPPLKKGVKYSWVVNALTQKQGLLGVGEGQFTVKP